MRLGCDFCSRNSLIRWGECPWECCGLYRHLRRGLGRCKPCSIRDNLPLRQSLQRCNDGQRNRNRCRFLLRQFQT